MFLIKLSSVHTSMCKVSSMMVFINDKYVNFCSLSCDTMVPFDPFHWSSERMKLSLIKIIFWNASMYMVGLFTREADRKTINIVTRLECRITDTTMTCVYWRIYMISFTSGTRVVSYPYIHTIPASFQPSSQRKGPLPLVLVATCAHPSSFHVFR